MNNNVLISIVLAVTLGIRLFFGNSRTKRGLAINCIQNGIFLGAGIGLIVRDAINGNLVWCIVDILLAAMFVFYIHFYYSEWKNVK